MTQNYLLAVAESLRASRPQAASLVKSDEAFQALSAEREAAKAELAALDRKTTELAAERKRLVLEIAVKTDALTAYEQQKKSVFKGATASQMGARS